MKGLKFALVNGIKTRYFEAGIGEPLLLVHGGQIAYASTALDWGPAFERLSEHFHVFAFDKIGQGFTDNPAKDEDYVIGSTIRHTLDFMKTLGIESAHLAGHSRGGYTVCRLALEHQEAAKSIIIVDSGTLMPTSPQDWYVRRDEKAAKITDTYQKIRFMKEANSFSIGHITEEWLGDTFLVVTSPNFKKATERYAILSKQFMDDLDQRVSETQQWIKEGRLKTPTLVIWGFNDPSAKFFPAGVDCMKLIMDNVPMSQAVVLNRAGHYGFREQNEAFVQAVKGFVQSLSYNY